ncbi:MAG TPA: toll/interleukin-1 receptor domain-containing protein [Ktedonobacteraceae bacterium]|jgi:hypothetical protein
MAIDVFIAYARNDRKLLDELIKHLQSLQRQGLIEHWFDGAIVEGTAWRAQLLDHLQSAQLILLLISPDFIASRFCYDVEMKEALKRHDAQEARVIPVILRPVEWYGLPFARIQMAPESARAVTLWENRDAAFLDVIKRIKTSVRELRTQSEAQEAKNMFMDNAQTQKRPAPPEQSEHPPVSWTVTNTIEQVSGGSIVTQGVHNSTTIYGNVPGKNESHEKLLEIIADLVEKTNELCDQHISRGESRHGEAMPIDPAYLKWFMDFLWEIKQRAVPIPNPLLVRVQQVCGRLHIPCFLMQ